MLLANAEVEGLTFAISNSASGLDIMSVRGCIIAEYKGILKTRLSAGLQVTSGMPPRPIHTLSHPEPEIDSPIRKEEKKTSSSLLSLLYHPRLVIMGVQKKTRKYALAKRAISMRDNRLFVTTTKHTVLLRLANNRL